MAYNHEYPYTDAQKFNDDWLLNKMKELDATFAKWVEQIAELEKALPRIAALEKQFAELSNLVSDYSIIKKKVFANEAKIEELETVLDGLDNRFKYIKDYVDAIKSELETKIYVQFNALLDKLYIEKAKTDAELKALLEYIKRVEAASAANVYNGVIGKRVSLDDNNKEIYQYMRYFGLTEAQLSELGLTEEQLRQYNLTNRDFAYYGKQFLKKLFIFSPVSGEKMPVYMAISEVLTYLCNTMTADEFAARNYTESELEGLDLTALEWLTFR